LEHNLFVMEVSTKTIFLFISILLSGLSAGFFYAWQVSVIPGTKQVSDFAYLETMQSINRAILNPSFFLVFFGSLLLLLISTVLEARTGFKISFWLVFAAMCSYLIGVVGVTMFGNVPLNEAIDILNLELLDANDISNSRALFEQSWNRWHLIRTVFSVLTFILALMAGIVTVGN